MTLSKAASRSNQVIKGTNGVSIEQLNDNAKYMLSSLKGPGVKLAGKDKSESIAINKPDFNHSKPNPRSYTKSIFNKSGKSYKRPQSNQNARKPAQLNSAKFVRESDDKVQHQDQENVALERKQRKDSRSSFNDSMIRASADRFSESNLSNQDHNPRDNKIRMNKIDTTHIIETIENLNQLLK